MCQVTARLADDITSETFLRAWSSTAPIREATVKSYLFAIASHLYLADLRRSTLSGEASADTRALVDAFMKDNAAFAAEMRERVDRAADVFGAPSTVDALPADRRDSVLADVRADGTTVAKRVAISCRPVGFQSSARTVERSS